MHTHPWGVNQVTLSYFRVDWMGGLDPWMPWELDATLKNCEYLLSPPGWCGGAFGHVPRTRQMWPPRGKACK